MGSNYDLYTDDTARLTAYYASPPWTSPTRSRGRPTGTRSTRAAGTTAMGSWKTTPTTTSCTTPARRSRRSPRSPRAARRGPRNATAGASPSSTGGGPGCDMDACAVPCGITCGFGKGSPQENRDGPTPPPRPFWILCLLRGSVARPRDAGRRRLRTALPDGSSPYGTSSARTY